MAMKIYRIGSLTFQFEEGEQPDGAIEVADAKPAEEPEKAPRKRRTAANKAKAAENK